MESRRSGLGIRVIGAMKLASAVLLVAAGFGIFRMVNRDLGEVVEDFVTRFHLDPDNRVVHMGMEWFARIEPRQLRLVGAGTFAYALLHLIEGTGLILKKRWAEYLTVIITSSLLPLEFYELARKVTALRSLVLAVNLAIVAYVAVQLVREHRERKD